MVKCIKYLIGVLVILLILYFATQKYEKKSLKSSDFKGAGYFWVDQGIELR